MKNAGKILPWMIIALTLAGAVVWDVHTPVSADDWCYLTVPTPGDHLGFWGGRGRHIENWADVGEAISTHFGMINGRLPNMLHTILAHIGHGLESSLLGISIGLFALLMTLAGDYKRKLRPWSAILGVLLMWSAMPWYDYFQSTDFQTNYVPISVMVLGLILLFPRINSLSSKAYTGTIALAFITGWMHEGFTIPLIIWVITSSLLCPEFRKSRTAGWVCALIAGLALILIGGIIRRLNDQTELIDYTQLPFYATRIISAMWPLWLASGLFAIDLITNKSGRKDIIRELVPLFAAAAIAAMIPVALMLFDRVYWPMALFSSLIIMRICTRWLANAPASAGLWALGVFTPLYSWWLFTLCKYEIRIGAEHEQIIAQIEDRQAQGLPFAGVYYLDIIHDDDIPSVLMGIVRQPLEDQMTTNRLASYYGGFFEFAIAADPELRGKAFEEWPKVPGNSGLRGRWPMLATSDTTHAHLIASAGSPTANMPPLDRALVAAKGFAGQPTDTVEHIFQFAYKPIAMPDGSRIYRCLIAPLPRTFRHRPLLRIDTLAVDR